VNALSKLFRWMNHLKCSFKHLTNFSSYSLILYVSINQRVKRYCLKFLVVMGHYLKLNSVTSVLKQIIPTEQPLLAGEVSANFCR
jgi:hypothetical protein